MRHVCTAGVSEISDARDVETGVLMTDSFRSAETESDDEFIQEDSVFEALVSPGVHVLDAVNEFHQWRQDNERL